LGLKEGDHAYLSSCLDAAVEKGEAVEHDMQDPEDPKIRHFFRSANRIPINASNKDLLVNVLEYWEEGPKGTLNAPSRGCFPPPKPFPPCYLQALVL
jgi:hypothetical protein